MAIGTPAFLRTGMHFIFLTDTLRTSPVLVSSKLSKVYVVQLNAR